MLIKSDIIYVGIFLIFIYQYMVSFSCSFTFNNGGIFINNYRLASLKLIQSKAIVTLHTTYSLLNGTTWCVIPSGHFIKVAYRKQYRRLYVIIRVCFSFLLNAGLIKVECVFMICILHKAKLIMAMILEGSCNIGVIKPTLTVMAQMVVSMANMGYKWRLSYSSSQMCEYGECELAICKDFAMLMMASWHGSTFPHYCNPLITFP